MSQLKKVMSGLTFDKKRNKPIPAIRRENQLKQGYRKMASLNLTLAQMCFDAYNEALSISEEKLTECE